MSRVIACRTFLENNLPNPWRSKTALHKHVRHLDSADVSITGQLNQRNFHLNAAIVLEHLIWARITFTFCLLQ